MRKIITSIHLVVGTAALTALLGACAPNNGTGFYASGQVVATVSDPRNGSTAQVGFNFPQNTRIDPTAASNPASVYTGVCSVGPTGRSLQITGNTMGTLQLKEFSVSLPPWDATTGTTTVSVKLNDSTAVFSSTSCSVNAVRRGSYNMDLTVSCQGLASASDPRTIAITANTILDDCDGPSTNSP